MIHIPKLSSHIWGAVLRGGSTKIPWTLANKFWIAGWQDDLCTTSLHLYSSHLWWLVVYKCRWEWTSCSSLDFISLRVFYDISTGVCVAMLSTSSVLRPLLSQESIPTLNVTEKSSTTQMEGILPWITHFWNQRKRWWGKRCSYK